MCAQPRRLSTSAQPAVRHRSLHSSESRSGSSTWRILSSAAWPVCLASGRTQLDRLLDQHVSTIFTPTTPSTIRCSAIFRRVTSALSSCSSFPVIGAGCCCTIDLLGPDLRISLLSADRLPTYIWVAFIRASASSPWQRLPTLCQQTCLCCSGEEFVISGFLCVSWISTPSIFDIFSNIENWNDCATVTRHRLRGRASCNYLRHGDNASLASILWKVTYSSRSRAACHDVRIWKM